MYMCKYGLDCINKFLLNRKHVPYAFFFSRTYTSDHSSFTHTHTYTHTEISFSYDLNDLFHINIITRKLN